jgi:hypothetical protein
MNVIRAIRPEKISHLKPLYFNSANIDPKRQTFNPGAGRSASEKARVKMVARDGMEPPTFSVQRPQCPAKVLIDGQKNMFFWLMFPLHPK